MSYNKYKNPTTLRDKLYMEEPDFYYNLEEEIIDDIEDDEKELGNEE